MAGDGSVPGGCGADETAAMADGSTPRRRSRAAIYVGARGAASGKRPLARKAARPPKCSCPQGKPVINNEASGAGAVTLAMRSGRTANPTPLEPARLRASRPGRSSSPGDAGTLADCRRRPTICTDRRERPGRPRPEKYRCRPPPPAFADPAPLACRDPHRRSRPACRSLARRPRTVTRRAGRPTLSLRIRQPGPRRWNRQVPPPSPAAALRRSVPPDRTKTLGRSPRALVPEAVSRWPCALIAGTAPA